MSAPGPCILSTANIHPECRFQEVQLWWQAPITGGAFDSYVISLAGTPVLTINDPTAYNTIITGLTNATEYEYSIQAQNSGTSTLGPSVSWRSVQPGNLPAAPSFVNFNQTGGATTTLNISWTGPTPNSNTGSVKWYILTLIPSYGNSIIYPILPYQRSLVASRLTSNIYAGQLVAINDSGYSPLENFPVKTVIALLGGGPYMGGVAGQGLAWTNDGINWNSSASSISLVGSGTYFCSAYNGSLWVAGAYLGTNMLVYSTDGINWLASTNGNTIVPEVYAISWNGTRWIAIGIIANGYSSNGITWTAITTNPTTNCIGLYSSISANLSVICGTGANPISYSTDGITWIAATSWPSFSQGYRVFYNGTRWVIGTGNSGTTSVLIYSSDAITWTASTNGGTIFTGGVIKGLAANGGVWVAGATGGANRLGWSIDGRSWAASTNGNSFFTAIYGITWTGTYFLAAGTGPNTCAYSADGKTWTASATNPITGNASGVNSSFPTY